MAILSVPPDSRIGRYVGLSCGTEGLDFPAASEIFAIWKERSSVSGLATIRTDRGVTFHKATSRE
jgi:hypothetical protein